MPIDKKGKEVVNILHNHDMGHRRIGIISEAYYSRSDVADKCRECSLT